MSILSLIPFSWRVGLFLGAFFMSNGWVAYKTYSITKANLTGHYEAKLLQKENQILVLHQAIKDMNTAAKAKQDEFNTLLRKAREAAPIEDEIHDIAIPKSPERAPVTKPSPVSRVPDRYRNSSHCRDC